MKLVFTPEAEAQADECDTWWRERRDARDLFARELAAAKTLLTEDRIVGPVGVTTIFPGFIRDAGMFADTGVKLPPGTGTRSPEDVANAVLRAIRKNPAEIEVAALEQSIAALVAGLSPGLTSALTRALGGDKISQRIIAAQAQKR